MLKNLKDRGVKFLDMGEVFLNHSAAKIQGISDFKMGFGGELRQCYKLNSKKRRVIFDLYKAVRGL